ncbi:unnamed protein product, partial [Symbiodinium necroappetens]
APADGSQAPSGPLAGEELGALRLGPLGNLARGEGVETLFAWAGPSEQALHRPSVRCGAGGLLHAEFRHLRARSARAPIFVEQIYHGRGSFESPLPLVYLLDDDVNPSMRVTAFLLKHRAGGFMVALPNTHAVSGIVTGLSEDGADQPSGFTEAEVACETPRRRPVGSVSVLLVDVPWSGLDLFRRGSSLRSSSLQLISILSGGAVVRPILAAALAAADAWINQAMAEPELQESMGEYATAAEEAAEDEVDGEGENEGEEPEPNEELARLRAHILERAAQSHPPPTGVGRASGAHGRRGARHLFPAGAGTGLSGGDLEHLRAAAG